MEVISFLKEKIQRVDNTLPQSAVVSSSPAQSFLRVFESIQKDALANVPSQQAIAGDATAAATSNLTDSQSETSRSGGFAVTADSIEHEIARAIERKRRDALRQSEKSAERAQSLADSLQGDASSAVEPFAQTVADLLEAFQSAAADRRSQLGLSSSDSSNPALSIGAFGLAPFSPSRGGVAGSETAAAPAGSALLLDENKVVAPAAPVVDLGSLRLSLLNRLHGSQPQGRSGDGAQSGATSSGLASYAALSGFAVNSLALADIPSSLYHDFSAQS